MRPHDEKTWPAQRPDADFASETVAAMLNDDARPESPLRGRRLRGRLGPYLVLAAAFVTTAAAAASTSGVVVNHPRPQKPSTCSSTSFGSAAQPSPNFATHSTASTPV